MSWECRQTYSTGDSEMQYLSIQDLRAEHAQTEMLACKKRVTGTTVIFTF